MKVGAKFAAHLSLRTLDHVSLSSLLEEKAVTLARQKDGLRLRGRSIKHKLPRLLAAFASRWLPHTQHFVFNIRLVSQSHVPLIYY